MVCPELVAENYKDKGENRNEKNYNTMAHCSKAMSSAELFWECIGSVQQHCSRIFINIGGSGVLQQEMQTGHWYSLSQALCGHFCASTVCKCMLKWQEADSVVYVIFFLYNQPTSLTASFSIFLFCFPPHLCCNQSVFHKVSWWASH